MVICFKRLVRTFTHSFALSILLMIVCSAGMPPPQGGISMPPGWDDSIIDKIKAGKSPKMVMAVLDFEGNEKLAGKVDVKLSDMLSTSLVKSQRFEMVERDKIDRVLKEQNFQMSGMVDESQAIEAGKLLGAEAVVFGSITSVTQTKIDKFAYDVLHTEISVNVRVVNATTGEILLSESATGESESKLITTADGQLVSGAVNDNSSYAAALKSAITQVGQKIANLTVLVGFVVDVTGSDITTDIGEERGIKKEDHIIVFRVGQEILHPVTGKHLGWKKEIIGEAIIQSTEKTMSAARIDNRNDDTEVKPGDYVIVKEER